MTDEEAKLSFIVAFFDDLDDKVAFLLQLAAHGRDDEARILATAYLDGLANWLSNDTSVARSFAKVLSEFGGEATLGLIIPTWLLESLPWKSAPPGAEAALRAAVAGLAAAEAFEEGELLTRLGPHLSDPQRRWVQSECWRGTVASAVFVRVRSPNTHSLGSHQALVFSEIHHNGDGLPPITFEMLQRVAARLAAHARQLSLKTGKWFGHH